MKVFNSQISKFIQVASFAFVISLITPSAWASEQLEDPVDQEGNAIVPKGQPPNSGGVGGVTNSGDEGTCEELCPSGYRYDPSTHSCEDIRP